MRPNDGWFLILSTAKSSSSSRERVWQFLKERWEDFKKKFQGPFILSKIIKGAQYSSAGQ